MEQTLTIKIISGMLLLLTTYNDELFRDNQCIKDPDRDFIDKLCHTDTFSKYIFYW